MRDSGSGCQVWWAALADVRPWHEGLLDPVERGRRERYVRPADRDRFTIGVALTRLVLAGRLGIPPERVGLDRGCDQCDAPHGPPRLVAAEGPGTSLSISHSGDRIVLALAEGGPIGVDVEADTGRIGPDIARHLLSAAEHAAFEGRGRPASTELLSYWTRKEAIVKATGEGLRAPLPELTVSAPGEPPRLVAWKGRPGFEKRVTLHTLRPGAGYSGCLALVDRPSCPVAEFSAAALLDDPGRAAGVRRSPGEMPLNSVEP